MGEIEIEIFLDLDGVIADFDGHVISQGKQQVNKPEWTEYSKLERAWWQTMPQIAGARAFFDSLEKMAPVTFLTGMVLENTDGWSGKAEWLWEFLPERGMYAADDLMVCRPKHKQKLAGPGRILVDDSEKNIEQWIAKGGIGIIHPRGSTDYAETLRKVAIAIATLQTANQNNATRLYEGPRGAQPGPA